MENIKWYKIRFQTEKEYNYFKEISLNFIDTDYDGVINIFLQKPDFKTAYISTNNITYINSIRNKMDNLNLQETDAMNEDISNIRPWIGTGLSY